MAVALLLTGIVGRVWADQVVSQETDYTQVKVAGYANGQLRLLHGDGSITTLPLADVQRMLIDTVGQMADFNDAERYLEEGQLQKAIVRYERALRMAADFWPSVIQVRLLQACDRARRFERAVNHFLAVAQEAPAAAAALLPRSIPDKPTPVTRRVVQRLTAEAAASTNDQQRVLLEMLRYAILIRTADPLAGQSTPDVAQTVIPEDIGTDSVYEIKVAACHELLAAAAFDAVLASVDQALSRCPEGVMPDLLLLKGRALLGRAADRQDLLAAGSAFMRLPIHFPDDQRAAQGLFWAAQVHERLDRSAKAVQLLKECLAHPQVGQNLQKRARAELARLEATPAP